jgi:hypothetical protein
MKLRVSQIEKNYLAVKDRVIDGENEAEIFAKL